MNEMRFDPLSIHCGRKIRLLYKKVTVIELENQKKTGEAQITQLAIYLPHLWSVPSQQMHKKIIGSLGVQV